MEVKPGYKQTEVGVIPEEWEADNLGRFWGVTDCKHVTAQFVPQGFPLASIREVQSRFVDLTNAKQTTAHFYNLLIEGGRKPRSGDLILSRNATVGEVAQVADWHPPFAMGQDVCLLRKKSNEHSTEFLQAIFQSPVILKQLADLMVGSTFKRANVQQIRNFAVPMPPPPEQRAIAEALSDVDGLLGGLDRLIAKKRDLKQAAMQQLLTGQTRLPGFHGEWEVKRLWDIVDFANGKPHEGHIDAAGQFYLVTLDSIGIDGKLKAEHKPIAVLDNSLQKDDIVTILSDIAHGNLLGLCDLIPEDNRYVLNQRVGRLRVKPDTEANPQFLRLQINRRQHHFKTRGQGTSQRHIYRRDFDQLELSLPKPDEQTAIAEVLTEMDAELAGLEQRREKTRALKQAMMQELLTGRTRLV